MNQNFLNQLLREHRKAACCPPPERVVHFHRQLVGLLFAAYAKETYSKPDALQMQFAILKRELAFLLEKAEFGEAQLVEKTVNVFFDQLQILREQLCLDVQAMYEGDPAAQSLTEVIRTYPGFYAMVAHRLAHALHQLGVVLIPRIISEHAHSKTGIDIHPAARIGHSFCIDHGTGIVIGETAEIGNHVKIYQGVTIGALSVNKEDAKKKRHPTIEDGVVIYAGATILGGSTVVGKNSVIGGNVWLTSSVPPQSKIYYKAKMSNLDGEEDIIVYK